MRLTKVLLTGLLMPIAFLPIASANAAPPGGHLNVVQVIVDDPLDPTSITIVGEDLDFGTGPLTVTLGEYVDPLVVTSATATEIIAQLPAEVTPDADTQVGRVEGPGTLDKHGALAAIGVDVLLEVQPRHVPHT